MKTVAAILLALAFAANPLLAMDWRSVAFKLEQSTVALRTEDGEIYCSGFVIDNERDYVMTAEHCVTSDWAFEGGIYVDGVEAVVVFEDEALDAAVLYVEGIDRPELKRRVKDLKRGQSVAFFGFAREMGFYEHFRVGVVAEPDGFIDGFPGSWVIVDNGGIGGHSGGPMVDDSGRVIAINQISDRKLWLAGHPIKQVWEKTKAYWK